MKITANRFAETSDKMFLVAVRKYGEQYPVFFKASDDTKMRDIFRSIADLSDKLSEADITEKMRASDDALCAPCGKHFLFKNYASSNETLKELGFDNSTVYTCVSGYATLFAA